MYNISLLYANKISCAVSPSHAPKLMLEGVSLKVVDPQSRECCLKGYAFLLEPENKVTFSLVSSSIPAVFWVLFKVVYRLSRFLL